MMRNNTCFGRQCADRFLGLYLHDMVALLTISDIGSIEDCACSYNLEQFFASYSSNHVLYLIISFRSASTIHVLLVPLHLFPECVDECYPLSSTPVTSMCVPV